MDQVEYNQVGFSTAEFLIKFNVLVCHMHLWRQEAEYTMFLED